MKIKIKYSKVRAIVMDSITEEVHAEQISVLAKGERAAVKAAKEQAIEAGMIVLHVKGVEHEEKVLDIPIDYLLAYERHEEIISENEEQNDN